jgi:polysaccharide export outer membrane protein
MSKGRWVAALTLCVLAAQTKAPPPVRPAEGKAASAAAPFVPNLTKDGRYVLQKGDEIAIKVLGVPELDQAATVGPDGRISVILVSELEAAGSTIEEVREKVARKYAEYYREPQVSLMVKAFANVKVFVGGEVERPGLLPLVGDISAAGAIMQVGGFRQTARKDHVVLLRNDGHDRPISLTLNLKEVLEKGAADVALKPFDVIYVPAKKIARVNQFMDEYVRKVLPLTLTGGFTYLWGNTTPVIH